MLLGAASIEPDGRRYERFMTADPLASLVQRPSYWASVAAATLGLAPAFIRLIETAASPSWLSWLYAVWLLAWILTAAMLVWIGWLPSAGASRRVSHAMTGSAMLLALVAFAGGPSVGAGLLVLLAGTTILAGTIAGFRASRTLEAVRRHAWLLAALGGMLLGLAGLSISLSFAHARIQMAMAGGSFLLGAGLSLALGADEATPRPADPVAVHEH
jgi:hypothetical protein